jgi:hypothetical protein
MAWPRWLERGAAIIFDEVFLSGAAAQKRLATVLDGLPVLWVGLRRDPDAAAAREPDIAIVCLRSLPRRSRWSTKP